MVCGPLFAAAHVCRTARVRAALRTGRHGRGEAGHQDAMVAMLAAAGPGYDRSEISRVAAHRAVPRAMAAQFRDLD